MRFNLGKLKAEQLSLAKKVRIKNEFEELSLVAGVDTSFIANRTIIAGIIVMIYPELKIVERQHIVQNLKMPYIPGFRAYREMPAIAEAYAKLEKKPHLVLLDANGILHPRKIGMASHFGVLQDIPTIGVAKKLLLGTVEGGKVKVEGEVRAQAVVTKEKAKPLYVSPGHRITLTKAVEIVLNCMRQPHKLPEPIHVAHRYVNNIREEMEREEQNNNRQIQNTVSENHGAED